MTLVFQASRRKELEVLGGERSGLGLARLGIPQEVRGAPPVMAQLKELGAFQQVVV